MSYFKILVVEDYERFRRFVCSLLQQRSDFQVIEASDGLEAVQKAEALQPDLILLDIGLPTLNGIEAAKRISQVVHGSKVIFLTVESNAEVAKVALGNGAPAYVLKSDAATELLQAIDAVVRGEMFVSSRLIGTKRHEELRPPAGLAPPLQTASRGSVLHFSPKRRSIWPQD